jgi:hypothetical protein
MRGLITLGATLVLAIGVIWLAMVGGRQGPLCQTPAAHAPLGSQAALQQKG